MDASIESIRGSILAISPGLLGLRVGVIAAGLVVWYLTQSLIGRRTQTTASDGGPIWDGIHELTAPIHQRLLKNPERADALLILSSLVIDVLGLYLLGSAILGATFEPFIGLLMLFALRQVCQAFCPLPPPPGMIWRKTGFPTLLVTYGTSNDLFFSGHTAIAIYGAAWLATHFGPAGIVLGVAIAIFEVCTVLILRAHYTMDVFTGLIAALYVYQLAAKLAPMVDGWLGRMIG